MRAWWWSPARSARYTHCCSLDGPTHYLREPSSLALCEENPDRPHNLDEEVSPTHFAVLLRSCTNAHAPLLGKQAHHHIIRCGLDGHAVLGGLLVHMYATCGALLDAWALFALITPTSSLLAWNSMITACSRHGQFREAIQLFDQVQEEGLAPSQATFVVTLSACASHVALVEGRLVHALIVKNGLEADVIVGTALLNMYGKSGSLKEAKSIFDRLLDRDSITWNAMITIYVHHGWGKEAMTLFDQMQWQGEMPNQATFVAILSACACNDVAAVQGVQIHARIMDHGFESEVILGNALVTLYAKCGSLENAQQVFDTMSEHNVVSWNAMISAHALNGQGVKSSFFFEQMKVEGVLPNTATFVSYLSACAASRVFAEGLIVHVQILSIYFGLDAGLSNSLLNMYAKCSRSMDAQRVFDMMLQRNLVSWTNMIAAYAQDGQSEKAFQLFDQMQQEGEMADKVAYISILDSCDSLAEGERLHVRIVACKYQSDAVVATALVTMYGKCNSTKNAKRVFYNMSERNEVSWSSMITVLAENGHDKEALLHYSCMQLEGLMADSFTLGSLLDACASQASLTEALQVHASIIGSKHESNAIIGTALVNLYGKCGSIPNAQRSFSKILHRDLISWNALIAAYAQHGCAMEVLQHLPHMLHEDIVPNEVTFISILYACSHAGLVSEGLHCFSSMCQGYAIVPTLEHYDCIIDLLGRAGRLDEAEGLIRRMPLQPTAVSLMTLLSACRYQSDIKRGRRIAQRIFHKNPENIGSYITLSNIYSTCKRVFNGAEILSMIKEENQENLPSCRSREMKTGVELFWDASLLLQNRLHGSQRNEVQWKGNSDVCSLGMVG